MAATSASRVRHLALVRPAPVYDDTGEPAMGSGFAPAITPMPSAGERWLACDRPSEKLRYGAYLCDCATCWASLARMVRVHRRPGLSIVIVTEADRIVTSARELLAQHENGDGYASMLWVNDDIVREVYVGRGATHMTRSEAQYHWHARCAREGTYLPRPRVEGAAVAGAVARHPASLGPTTAVSIRLPRELERAARAVAAEADLDLEEWIVEALRTSVDR